MSRWCVKTQKQGWRWTQRYKKSGNVIQTFWWFIDKAAICWKCDISESLESWHPSHMSLAQAPRIIFGANHEESDHSRFALNCLRFHLQFSLSYFVGIPQLSARVILHDVFIVSHLFLRARLLRCLTLCLFWYISSWFRCCDSYLFGNMIYLFQYATVWYVFILESSSLNTITSCFVSPNEWN